MHDHKQKLHLIIFFYDAGFAFNDCLSIIQFIYHTLMYDDFGLFHLEFHHKCKSILFPLKIARSAPITGHCHSHTLLWRRPRTHVFNSKDLFYQKQEGKKTLHYKLEYMVWYIVKEQICFCWYDMDRNVVYSAHKTITHITAFNRT